LALCGAIPGGAWARNLDSSGFRRVDAIQCTIEPTRLSAFPHSGFAICERLSTPDFGGCPIASLPVLKELPAGYFREESPGGILVMHSDVIEALHEAGFGPESDGELVTSELHGRKPLFELRLGQTRFVVRRFSHGGLMRWITGERFLDPERPFRELILSDSLRRLGIETPQVVAARARWAGPLGWKLEVMTRRVEESVDLGVLLTAAGRGELDAGLRRRLMRETGALVRRMHVHGYLHADLQPANILVKEAGLQGGALEMSVLDLDGSVFHHTLTSAQRCTNLRRLFRHIDRRAKAHGRSISVTDQLRFMRGYDPDGTRWRDDWRSIERAHARSRWSHAIGWFFESLFGQRLRPRERNVRPHSDEAGRS
jgi:tRNA A-37 threonylcarbamoyl transferase component Bud32